MPLSALWVWGAAVRRKGHNSKVYSNRRVVATLVTLRRNSGSPCKRSQEAVCLQCDMCFFSFLFLLFLNSKILTHLRSPSLPEMEMFSNILSTKHPGIPSLSCGCLPLAPKASQYSLCLSEHRCLGKASHPPPHAPSIFDKVPVLLFCYRGVLFIYFGEAEQEAHLEGSGRFWC